MLNHFTDVATLIDAVNTKGVVNASLRLPIEIMNNPARNLEEITKLANFLATDPGLKYLDLNDNKIGPQGGVAIANSLITNSRLQWLLLSTTYGLHKNKIGNPGGVAFGNSLATNSGLQYLDLSGNKIGTQGGVAIGNSLATNSGLKSLDLSKNNMGTPAAIAIGNSLATNSSLKSLGLRNYKFFSGNIFWSKGGAAIKEGLKENITMTICDNYGNGIGHKLEQDIDGLLRRNSEIPHAVHDYAISIVGAKLVQAINGDPSISQQEKENFRIRDHTKEINDLTQNLLFKNTSIQEKIEFSTHWHKPLQQQRSLAHKDYSGQDWPPLFGKKEIPVPKIAESWYNFMTPVMRHEGWKLVARTNPAELREEGKNLKHCVGGYAGQCITENSHIISVVDPKGKPVSTIEIQTDYTKEEYKIEQHRGSENLKKPPVAGVIETWFTKQIDSGAFKINYSELSAARDARVNNLVTFEKKATRDIGYNPLDKEKCKAINGTYHRMLDGQDTIRNNFENLVKVQKLDFGQELICGKSTFTVPTEPDKVKNLPGNIKERLQDVLDALIGKGQTTITIEENSKNKHGNVVITATQSSESVRRLLSEAGLECSNEKCSIRITNKNPLPVLQILTKQLAQQATQKTLESGNVLHAGNVDALPGVVVAPSASAAVEVVTVQVIPPTATIQPTVNIRAPTTDAVGTNPLSFATQSPATTAVDKVKDISVDRRPEETRQEYSTQNTAVVPSNAVTDAIRIKTKFIDPISQNLALSQPQQGEMSTTGSASRSVPNLHANQIGIAPVNM